MSKDIVVEVTGKMPFVGKHMVKYWFQKGREAARSGDLDGKLENAVSLGAFAVAHAIQMQMGVLELVHHADQNPLLVGVDALYTTVNAMVTYTQASLAARVLATPSEQTAGSAVTSDYSPISSTTGDQLPKPDIKLGDVTLAEFGTTLGGQVLFLATMQ